MSFQSKNVYWLWLSAAIIVADQISKQVVIKNLAWFEVYPLFDHFNFVHLRNTGAAFSMFATLPPWSFALLGCAVSVYIVWWLRANPRGQDRIAAALALILGGALGNVIDRVRLGHVTDFIDFYVGEWHFAAFNIADMAISVGAGLMLLDMFIEWRRERAAKIA